jgi:hypothetical protein
MLNFFLKQKPIVIDAFTYKEEVHDLYAPELSSRFVPKWWKDLESTYSMDPSFPQIKHATAKRCIGIIESYKNGFMIPLWSDVAINLTRDNEQRSYRYMFADQVSNAVHHHSIQYGNFIDADRIQHLKLGSPWKLREKSGVKFSLNQPTWNLGNHMADFSVIPGVTDFKYQDSTNIQMMFYYPESNGTKQLLIEAGTPMYHVIPLSDRPIKIVKHLVSKEEWESSGNSAIKFNNSYKVRKTRMDNQESKCPFGRMFK